MGIVCCQIIRAQDNTFYYMRNVPQVTSLNPANQPPSNFFVSIPLSVIQLNASNNAVSLNDIFFKNQDDSISRFYQTNATTDKFLSKFDKLNYLSVNGSSDILSLGFRSKRMYFTLNYTLHENNRIMFPKELVSFLTLHIPSDVQYDLSTFNIDITQYQELGLGISRQFGDQITIGIRPKILFGISTISSNTHSFSVNSDPITKNLTFTINSDIKVCAPGIIIPVDSAGAVDLNGNFNFDSANVKTTSDYIHLATQNMGLGIDAGINYRPIERLEFSASIIDLGYINWSHYSHIYNVQGSYAYAGAEYNSIDSTTKSPDIIDSLKTNFKATGSESSFTTHLVPILYVGGRFFVTPKFDVGILSRFEFYKDGTKSKITILTDWRPLEIWNVSASYGLLNGSNSTFGLGMSFRFGFFNFFIVSDDIPTTYTLIKGKTINYPMPNDQLAYNLQFGINIVLGSSLKKKLRQDQPMYISEEY